MGLNVTNLASVSATLNWINPGSATQWEVEVVPVASAPTGVGVITGAPTYSAAGLRRELIMFFMYVRFVLRVLRALGSPLFFLQSL